MEIDYGQGWLFGRPGEAWPADATPAAVPPVPRQGQRPARARPRARVHGARRQRGGRRPPGPPRPAAVGVPRPGRPPALPGRARVLAGLRRAVRRRPGSSAACSGPASRRSSRTSATRRTTCPTVPGVRAEVCFAAARRRPDRRRARRRVADRDRRRHRGRGRALRGAAVRAAGGGRRARPRLARPAAGPHRRAAGVLGGPRGRRARGAGRRARAVRLRVRRWSRWPTATARCTRTWPRARSRSRSASSTPHELAAMAVWVDEGTSSYTVGDTAGRGFAGHEVLRRAGVGSLIVLPLVAAGERVGLIVVADRAHRRPAFEDIELLELLALQAANGLRMASVLSQLRVVARPADRPARVAADRRARRGPARRHRRPRRDQRRPRPGRGRRRPARHGRAAARADARGRPGVPDRGRRVRGDAGRAPRAGR